MSGYSYHELTMNQPRNSPGQRKQFLVICVGGFSVFLHAVISAGILEPLSIYDDGYFPGGSFVHKMITRDYAASMGAIRKIGEDVDSILADIVDEDATHLELNLDLRMDPDQPTAKDAFVNLTYSVFLDDTDVFVPGGEGRFCSGVLLDQTTLHIRDYLLEKNSEIHPTDEEKSFWSYDYTVTELPKVRAAVATFPYTNGFISALIHKFKVFPAMVKFAQAHGVERPIVISTRCDIENSMCIHYIPLERGVDFLMGQPDTATYAKTIPPTNLLDIGPAINLIKSVFGFKTNLKDDEL
jgi:hypothetical protein